VKQEERVIHSIDTDYWAEVLGISFEDNEPNTEPKKAQKTKTKFPLTIQAQHRGQIYTGELLDLQGNIRLNGQVFTTPSGAAKTIATDWKEVNGWKFWKYENPESEKWEYISSLKEK
jgi:hypothetical protein